MKLPVGYSFVPAAMLYNNYGGLAIYVKYAKSGVNDITVKRVGKNHIWYVCPDREIVLVRDNFQTESFKPDGFDKYVDLNLFRDSVSSGLGFEYGMTNYTHDNVCHNTSIDRGAVSEKDKRVQILSDSGGLQLVRGVSTLIHPKDLVNFYNNTVDAGMILDVPMLFVDDPKVTLRAAKLQKRNNEIMLANSRKGLELINIFHGRDLESKRQYRDIVEDERIPRVAIGGLYTQKPVTFVNSMYDIIQGGAFRYRQYHALGIFVTPLVMLLVKIANSGDDPPHITSDSSSHVQASLNNVYHVQSTEAHIMSRLALGTKAGSTPNPAMRLLCSCPVCRNIKYRDILAFGHNRFNGFLAVHNAIEMVRWTKSLQTACRELTPAQYNKYCLTQLRHSADKDEVKFALDFVDMVTQEGLAKAQKKYANFLNNWKGTANSAPSNLFESESADQTAKAASRKQTLDVLAAMEAQIK